MNFKKLGFILFSVSVLTLELKADTNSTASQIATSINELEALRFQFLSNPALAAIPVTEEVTATSKVTGSSYGSGAYVGIGIGGARSGSYVNGSSQQKVPVRTYHTISYKQIVKTDFSGFSKICIGQEWIPYRGKFSKPTEVRVLSEQTAPTRSLGQLKPITREEIIKLQDDVASEVATASTSAQELLAATRAIKSKVLSTRAEFLRYVANDGTNKAFIDQVADKLDEFDYWLDRSRLVRKLYTIGRPSTVDLGLTHLEEKCYNLDGYYFEETPFAQGLY